MKVVALYSIKGGVGKTTAAVNLAHAASVTGARVLLWDLDPQGAATFFVRVRPKVRGGSKRLVGKKGGLEEHVRATDLTGVHVIPADFSLRHLDVHLDATKKPVERLAALLAPVAAQYDLAVLDCAPGISLASESVFGAADMLIVPTIPTTLSARTLDQLDEFLGRLPHPPAVRPFFSMVDRRKSLHRELVDSLAERWPRALHTPTPSASAVERMGVERSPVGVFAPRSAAATAFGSLWQEIADELWSSG
jgi:cellulose biosynthesis protein BcsQ